MGTTHPLSTKREIFHFSDELNKYSNDYRFNFIRKDICEILPRNGKRSLKFVSRIFMFPETMV